MIDLAHLVASSATHRVVMIGSKIRYAAMTTIWLHRESFGIDGKMLLILKDFQTQNLNLEPYPSTLTSNSYIQNRTQMNFTSLIMRETLKLRYVSQDSDKSNLCTIIVNCKTIYSLQWMMGHIIGLLQTTYLCSSLWLIIFTRSTTRRLEWSSIMRVMRKVKIIKL